MMKKLVKLQNDNQGFTLVELMIVVAIIGILAAIAIPQFAAYRIRGYNSSAQSDVRNLNTSQAAFFSDWQTYGETQMIAALPGPGGNGGAAAQATIAVPGGNFPAISMNDNGGTARGLQIPVGNGVTLVSSTDAAAAPAIPTSFVAIGKHLQGDSFYGVDGDSTAVYQDNSAAVPGTSIGYQVAVGDEPGSTPGIDDFGGANGPSGALWTVR